MTSKSIRWLHLSDFHVGKDDYGQDQLFGKLIEEINDKIRNDRGPELIFITGDIANAGLKTEYEAFIDGFLLPLMEAHREGQPLRIYIVPGNHDVNRKLAEAVLKHGALAKVPRFLDPSIEGADKRKDLLQRFAGFITASLPDIGGAWLRSPEGAFTDIVEKEGHRIGILGLNTAWLSESDEDKGRLSPGKEIIETGLAKLKECDIRIVLGHHPLDWFMEEWVQPIRALFGQNNVIYLHGHLHKNESRREEGAGRLFLTLQGGAAFQARDNDIWRNRILWCELDLEAGQLQLWPRQWVREGQEWTIDPSFPELYRVPDTDRWLITLPTPPAAMPPTAPAVRQAAEKLITPDGWKLIDGKELDRHRLPLSPDAIGLFFDGRIPTWQHALSPEVPRRTIVYKLLSDFRRAREEKISRVTLLLGAGGEGKSTVLRQVVCDLVDSNQGWKVFWHNNRNSHLPVDYLLKLPQSDLGWLFVSDEADAIAEDLFEAVKNLEERSDILFLLSCRTTDWKSVRGEQYPWKSLNTTFVEEPPLNGLDLPDAVKIVEAWEKHNEMGQLQGVPVPEAAKQLVEASYSERGNREGAFLGAMLQLRLGEEMQEHVTGLLRRLKARAAPGPDGNLMAAFAYIAIMHAENQFILSPKVLAAMLGCQERVLRREVIIPLAEEAAGDTHGPCVLTRHRAIAEAAVQSLIERFQHDFDYDESVVELVQAAERLFLNNQTLINPGAWAYIASHFFERGKRELGIRLADLLVSMSPQDPYLLTQLARLLRENEEGERSRQLFRNSPEETHNDRGFYLEWATAEGTDGNDYVSAYLAAVALSDDDTMKSLDSTLAKMSLNSLSYTFSKIFYAETSGSSVRNITCIEACSAAAQLGLMLPVNSKTIQTEQLLHRSQAKAQHAGIQETDLMTALQRLLTGIIFSAEHLEESLPRWVKAREELGFQRLLRLLKEVSR